MSTLIFRSVMPAALAAPISNDVLPSFVGVPARVPLPPGPPLKAIPGGRAPKGTKTVGVGLPAAVTVKGRACPAATEMLSELVKCGSASAPGVERARPAVLARSGPWSMGAGLGPTAVAMGAGRPAAMETASTTPTTVRRAPFGTTVPSWSLPARNGQRQFWAVPLIGCRARPGHGEARVHRASEPSSATEAPRGEGTRLA